METSALESTVRYHLNTERNDLKGHVEISGSDPSYVTGGRPTSPMLFENKKLLSSWTFSTTLSVSF